MYCNDEGLGSLIQHKCFGIQLFRGVILNVSGYELVLK